MEAWKKHRKLEMSWNFIIHQVYNYVSIQLNTVMQIVCRNKIQLTFTRKVTTKFCDSVDLI